jgi:DNA polymerase-3 subunit epsilon
VVIIASPHNTELPMEIAAAGGRVMANVGQTTTMLVVAGARPFSSGVRSTASFLKAEALAAEGGALSILTADEVRDRIATATAA